MSKTFPANQDEAIEKLMEENRRLTIEKDTAQQLYLSSTSFMNSMNKAKMQKDAAKFKKQKKRKRLKRNLQRRRKKSPSKKWKRKKHEEPSRNPIKTNQQKSGQNKNFEEEKQEVIYI